MTRYTLSLSLLALGALACDPQPAAEPPPLDAGGGGEVPDVGGGLDGGAITDAPYVIAPRGNLVWKRQVQLAADLSQGLGIPGDQLCKELELADCFDVHQVSLGGNDPLGISMYEPVAEPLSTTPAVVERIALAACARAADRDAQADPPVTFTRFPLGDDPLDVTDPGAAHDQIDDLYKALIGRTSSELERARITTLAAAPDAAGEGAPSSRDFAVLACFTVATTTEFLFY